MTAPIRAALYLRVFVSFGQFGDLASGKISASPVPGGSAIDWTFEAPDWLRGRAMRTLSISDGGQSVRLNMQAVTTAGPTAMKP
jgi:hypothetical protein